MASRTLSFQSRRPLPEEPDRVPDVCSCAPRAYAAGHREDTAVAGDVAHLRAGAHQIRRLDGMTQLGMPAPPPPTEPTWKQAWDAALYGTSGYLRRHPPRLERDPDALLALVARQAPEDVALLGAAGVLAPSLAAAMPGLQVRHDIPDAYGGLVLAVDWLSHVPAHVVRVDDQGAPRIVHVDPVTGREQTGSRLSETVVPQGIGLWLQEWWPVADGGPGARAEVGTGRDAAWRDVVRRLAGGTAIAVEHGHVREARPRLGSLHCPAAAEGAAQRCVPDGQRDLCADVALDAVATATEGRVVHDGVLTRVECG